MAPTVRALAAGGRDDVLWDLLQEDDQPSYGYFMAVRPPANPGGMTTIGERWNRGDSKNHMILAQIEEWFHVRTRRHPRRRHHRLPASWSSNPSRSAT